MKKVKLVDISKLKSHERINRNHLKRIIREFQTSRVIKNPVVIDRKTFVVLDGHHRVAALKILGCQKIPVMFVNYQSNKVRVYLRRKNLLQEIIKETVVSRAFKKNYFPIKTTRHYISRRIKNIKYKLEKLKQKSGFNKLTLSHLI